MVLQTLRIATRTSDLAKAQTHLVCATLQAQYPELSISIVPVQTAADREPEKPITAFGSKGVFVKALEQALLTDQADVAVHSVKDMSVHPVPGLLLAAMLQRAAAQDVCIFREGLTWDTLPAGAVIGTSSPRRAAQLQCLHPGLNIKAIRGNVPTRLEKLAAGHFDAIVLAKAGLDRLGYQDLNAHVFSTEQMLPAVGQGAVGLQCRSDDQAVIDALAMVNHSPTQQAVMAERQVALALNAGCQTALAAYAYVEGDQMHLAAQISQVDGAGLCAARAQGSAEDFKVLGEQVAQDLLAQGAQACLKESL